MSAPSDEARRPTGAKDVEARVLDSSGISPGDEAEYQNKAWRASTPDLGKQRTQLAASPEAGSVVGALDGRDFDAQPYTTEERRICDYLIEITRGKIGCGADPIGFLIASHYALLRQRRTTQAASGDAASEDAAQPKDAQ